LDGAVARAVGPTDFGGFLDIVLDFIFYAMVPLSFAIYDPANALAAGFLIFSFLGTGVSFLAFAIMAEKRGFRDQKQGKKSFYYLGGLTEGGETIILLLALTLTPAWFVYYAVGFGILCWITTASRVYEARLLLDA
jgi:phosphatidylglycerophosphate synthase